VELKTIRYDPSELSFKKWFASRTWTQSWLGGVEKILVGFRQSKKNAIDKFQLYQTQEMASMAQDWVSL
jgi:hypothetical protein